jgi:hypothetical protein
MHEFVQNNEYKGNKLIYYMTSDNVFSDWLTSIVTFFDKTFYCMTVIYLASDWLKTD